MNTGAVPTGMRGAVSRAHLLIALLAGVGGVAGSYAVAGYTRQFVVAPIDALVVRSTPGQIVAFTIQNLGEDGHLLHISLSLAIATGLLAGAALAGLVVARKAGRPVVGIGLAGGVAWGLTAAVTSEPALALGAAAPVGVVTALGATPRSAVRREPEPGRRRVLAAGASALAATGIAVGVRHLGGDGTIDEDGPPDVDADAAALVEAAEDRSLDVQGDVPGLVSTFEEFYHTDIAEFDPEVAAADWELSITGAVDEAVTVTYDELTAMPTERRYVTLRCVGEDLNGHKLDTAVWTGTPIGPLLEAADPGGECGCAMLRAADDYFVQFPVDALEDGFLAWGMNGQALPQGHGHPVRVLVPGHWGETNVKWLEEIELLDEAVDGYWEQRGWHGTGPVNTVAKLWSDTTLADGHVEVSGHAYAGTRGVERVEVSTDGGDTWTDAELSVPLPGEDVWRQWRHVFDPDGSHEVVVRAIDGEGTVQPEERSDSFPSGATGWVSRTVEPDGDPSS